MDPSPATWVGGLIRLVPFLGDGTERFECCRITASLLLSSVCRSQKATLICLRLFRLAIAAKWAFNAKSESGFMLGDVFE